MVITSLMGVTELLLGHDTELNCCNVGKTGTGRIVIFTLQYMSPSFKFRGWKQILRETGICEKKRDKKFDLPERGFEPQIFSYFPHMIWIFMWCEEPEIKSKQVSKRDSTSLNYDMAIVFMWKKTVVWGKWLWKM